MRLTKKDINQKLEELPTPSNITIRAFEESDFPHIQSLYEQEGWLTIIKRPEDGLAGWHNAYPSLVALDEDNIIGAVRSLTDGVITTFIIELIIDKAYRGQGIGQSLIEACHILTPSTRIEVLATESSKDFYLAHGFRSFYGFRKSY